MKSVPIADEALIHEMMRRAPVSPERAPTKVPAGAVPRRGPIPANRVKR